MGTEASHYEAGAGRIADWARRLAEAELTEIPRRWAHAHGAAAQAREIADCVGDGELLQAAAWVHDIGFAPAAVETGFSALDGARWLRAHGAPDRLVNLVANNAFSRLEGELRGFTSEYEEFEDEATPVRDALWYCCLTTGPDGGRFTLDERMAEWGTRYRGDSVIARYTEIAPPVLRQAVERTTQRLAVAGGR